MSRVIIGGRSGGGLGGAPYIDMDLTDASKFIAQTGTWTVGPAAANMYVKLQAFAVNGVRRVIFCLNGTSLAGGPSNNVQIILPFVASLQCRAMGFAGIVTSDSVGLTIIQGTSNLIINRLAGQWPNSAGGLLQSGQIDIFV